MTSVRGVCAGQGPGLSQNLTGLGSLRVTLDAVGDGEGF